MNSSSSPTTTPTTAADATTKLCGARSSVIESLRGCGLAGARYDKEELKAKLIIPKYIRVAIRSSLAAKDVNAGVGSYWKEVREARNGVFVDDDCPDGPIVVFINSMSGGRHGPELKARLLEMMGEEQVLDLAEVKPQDFVSFGIGCLDKLAEIGDQCAREIRKTLRIMVAGGDGSVGWVLGSLSQLAAEGREPVPPVGIIPLGTGNDLSRSFGWGGSFPFAWKAAIKRTLTKAINAPVLRLDSWQLRVSLPSGTAVDPPHSLKHTEDHILHENVQIEGRIPENVNSYVGVFYNYFSIGMDARVAYGFHRLRNEKPYLAQGPMANKASSVIFFTFCFTTHALDSTR